MTNEVGIAWVAAILAPWAVSPHPNFSEKDVSAESEFAMITERRERETARDKYSMDDLRPGWAGELLSASRGSLVASTQAESAELLWDLAFRDPLPLGARVAAACYASLAFVEIERTNDAVNKLEQLIRHVEADRNPEGVASSERLAIAALQQQCVARMVDASRFGRARGMAHTVGRWLPKVTEKWTEEFRVSKGLSWKSGRVQRDMAESLHADWLSATAYLEQFEGRTWVKVVRGRSGWIDARQQIRRAEGDAAVVRDEFESRFESTSGKRVFMRESAAAKSYEALLAVELAGDVGRIASAREELGKIHLLYADGDVHLTRESLRLLRQARAAGPLQTALRWVRYQGPSDALAFEARKILGRVAVDGVATEHDLLTLDYAADFLSLEELNAGLDACLTYVATERVSNRPDWSVQDKAWKTIGRLLPGSNRDNEFVLRALEFVRDSTSLETLESTLVRLVDAADWSAVDQEIRDSWGVWADAPPAGKEDLAELRASIRDSVSRAPLAPTYSGLRLAAALADREDRTSDFREEASAISAIFAALDSETVSALKGSYSFGGLSPLNVAVAFALRYSNAEVWAAVVTHLGDERLDGTVKELALDRVARNAKRIPANVVELLRPSWPLLIRAKRRDNFFSSNSFAVFPEALRAGAALGFVDLAFGIEGVMSLASEGDAGKVEAAQSIPYVSGLGDPTWAHVLLLQYSYDDNPMVRAEAAYAMTQIRPTPVLGASVRTRLTELLRSDGVRVPLRIIHGLQAAEVAGLPWANDILHAVDQLDEENTPRVVRDAVRTLQELTRQNTRPVGF